MTELEDLKKECSEVEAKLSKMNSKLCKKLILHDIKVLGESDKFSPTKEKNHFNYNQDIFIFVNDEGYLEIEDRHKDRLSDSFLWHFGIKYKEKIRISDNFELNNFVYSVQSLEADNDTHEIREAVRKVISEYKESISILNNGIPKDGYEYESCSPGKEVICDTLQEVIDIVSTSKY